MLPAFLQERGQIEESWKRTKGKSATWNPQIHDILVQNIDVDYVVYEPDREKEYVQYFEEKIYKLPDDRKSKKSLSRTVIRIFGTAPDGAAVMVYVHGFYPYLYAELELSAEKYSHPTPQILADIVDCVGVAEELLDISVYAVSLVQRTNIYGYHEPSWFIKIELYVPSDIPKLRTLIEGNHITTAREKIVIRRTFESNVEFVTRFMVDINVPGCGWTCLPHGGCWTRRPKKFRETSNENTLEVDIYYKNLQPRDDLTHLAPLVVLCFDIECKGTGGEFPRPRNPGDKVIHIANYVVTAGAQSRVLHWTDFCLGTCAPVRKEGACVYTFYSEESLLATWAEFVRAVNPDLVMGYNSVDFDLWYLLERAAALNIDEEFSFLGKIAKSKSVLKQQKFSSKAYGTQYTTTARLHGRMQFDVLLVLKRDVMTKLRSYKLGDVAQTLLKMKKDDMDYKLIPTYHAGTDKNRRKLAEYCLQDALLPKLICDKKLYDRAYIEMARVCMVPLRFLLEKGQQVKVAAQILKFCHDSAAGAATEHHYIMPFNVPARNLLGAAGYDDSSSDREVAYKGAIVLDPVKGWYPNDVVAVLDFASLYPSIIIAFNLCYSTLILLQEAEKMGWVLDLDYEISPNGEAFLLNEKRAGVLPLILRKLLLARAEVKNQMKKVAEGCDEYKGLDGRQGGLKTTSNSVYGFTGATKGRLPMLEVSSTVTGYGRLLIEMTKAIVEACTLHMYHKDAAKRYRLRYHDDDDDDKEEEGDAEPARKKLRTNDSSTSGRVKSLQEMCATLLGIGDDIIWVAPPEGWFAGPGRKNRERGTTWQDLLEQMRHMKKGEPQEKTGHMEVIYGDSVAADTPILCRTEDHRIVIRSIDMLAKNSRWKRTIDEKEVAQPSENFCIWTETGWTVLRRIIRHKTKKRMFRVLTHTGCVDVTEDHSLLTPELKEIKPSQVAVGDLLLHADLPLPQMRSLDLMKDNIVTIDQKRAYCWGFFYADGSCGRYLTPKNGIKSSWAINKQNVPLLEKTAEYLREVHAQDGCSFKILDTLNSSGVYKLVPCGAIANLVTIYRALFYDERKLKKVPDEILNASPDIRLAFWQGYYAGDGDKDIHGYVRCDNKGKIGAAGLYYVMNSLGYPVSINIRSDKPHIFRLTATRNSKKQRIDPTKIKKIVDLGISTDSSYVYDLETENHHFSAGIGRLIVHNTDSVMVRIHGINSVKIGHSVAKALCRIINQYFPNDIKLIPEKVLTGLTLLGKKKYYGLEWLNSVQPSQVNAKGLESVRRDNPLFLNDLMKKVQEALLGWSPTNNPTEVRRPNVKKAIGLVRECQSAILANTLPIPSYVVTKSYSKRETDYVNPQEHIEVVKKMVKRDEATAPKMGDRVEYVLTQSHKDAKNFEKAEDPKWVEKNNLPIDTEHYIMRMKMAFLRIFTPVLAPHRMWKRPEGRKPPENEEAMKEEKKEEKKYLEKMVYPLVARRIFSGDHTRKVVKPTPKEMGIVKYFKPVLFEEAPEERQQTGSQEITARKKKRTKHFI